MRRLLSSLFAAAIVGAACFAASSSGSTAAGAPAARQHCALPRFTIGRNYHPTIRPADFRARVDNPWFPLIVGTTWVYSGVKDGARSVDVVVASRHTRRVDRVLTRVVQDRLLLNGVLRETTRDYYAQDRCGNVWYFGEDTAELDRSGHVLDRSGSWHAGVRGAQPGVYMQRYPHLGRRFRQEWYPGQAEDQYTAVAREVFASEPVGMFRHALRTRETSRLEPGVVDAKLYVRGLGELRERAVQGDQERLDLVAILH